ncbi:MAG: transcriptional repressor LexA [Thermodesulfobacteriota bacterium]|nr:transcriptional repressor LexA [Thermodesulfobacteriota bacterium]
MKKDLTARQREILQYILTTIKESGYPPSIREIGKAMGIKSLGGVTCHLNALEKKGHIKRGASHRGIRVLLAGKTITEGNTEIVRLPLLGRIAAGEPILAEQNIEDWIPLPKFLVRGNRDLFLLRVRGDSMKEDHILDGDLIVVRHQMDAENGEIIVAVIDGEATVKRFYRQGDHVRLQPANPGFRPIVVKGDFQVCGKVIGLFRSQPGRVLSFRHGINALPELTDE